MPPPPLPPARQGCWHGLPHLHEHLWGQADVLPRVPGEWAWELRAWAQRHVPGGCRTLPACLPACIPGCPAPTPACVQGCAAPTAWSVHPLAWPVGPCSICFKTLNPLNPEWPHMHSLLPALSSSHNAPPPLPLPHMHPPLPPCLHAPALLGHICPPYLTPIPPPICHYAPPRPPDGDPRPGQHLPSAYWAWLRGPHAALASRVPHHCKQEDWPAACQLPLR